MSRAGINCLGCHLEVNISLSPQGLHSRGGWQSITPPIKLASPRVVRVRDSSHAGVRLPSTRRAVSWAPQLEDQYQKVCGLAVQLLATLFRLLLNLYVHLFFTHSANIYEAPLSSRQNAVMLGVL